MNICEIAFLSVKGGSGKSTLVSSFLMWLSLKNKKTYILDACLSNPVIEHFLDIITKETFDYTGSSVATIDCDLCIHCDECRVHCTFGAVENKEQFFIKPDACTGCNMCVTVCPVDAINMIPKRTGQWKVSESSYGEIIHGWATKDSPKLIQIIKKEAIFRANMEECDYLVINSPAGLTLDTKYAAESADKRIAIIDSNVRSESYVNALEDFSLENDMTMKIILNNTGLNPDIDESLRKILADKNMDLLGELPFSREIAKFNSLGIIPYSHDKDLDELLESVFKKIIL